MLIDSNVLIEEKVGIEMNHTDCADTEGKSVTTLPHRRRDHLPRFTERDLKLIAQAIAENAPPSPELEADLSHPTFTFTQDGDLW